MSSWAELVDEQTLRKVCADIDQMPGVQHYDPRECYLQRHEILAVARKLPKSGTLLDVGCGTGFVPRYFHYLGAKVISVDFPGTGGLDALKSLMNQGIQGHYVCVGAEPLPLPDNSIDVVFVGNVIEHLADSPKAFVADLKRVLKPSGHLIMDTRNAVDLKARVKVLWGVSNWTPLETFYELGFNPHHHKEYTLAELAQLFGLAGFRNLEPLALECFFQRSLKKFRRLNATGRNPGEASSFGPGFNPWHPYEYARILFLLMVKLFPNLRSDIMVIGQK